MKFTADSKNYENSAKLDLELLFKTTHLLRQKFAVKLEGYVLPKELTGPRMGVLMEVDENNGIKMNELAAKLGIRARTVTEYVDSLEQSGYIMRIPDSKDRRATLLQLTSAAQSVMEQAEMIMDTISEELLAALTSEQRQALFQILKQLYIE